MNVVLYARVSQPSAQDSEDKVSIDQQLKDMHKLCTLSFSTHIPCSNTLKCHFKASTSNPTLEWRSSTVAYPSLKARRISLLTGLLIALR